MGRPMRIVIEPMGYHLLNLGDVAIRQMTVRRLRELWPTAQIEMFADDPDALCDAIPGVQPLSTVGRRRWFYAPLVPLARARPEFLTFRLTVAERRFRRRHTRLAERAARLRHPRDAAAVAAFLDAVRGADLLVVGGGGALNDHYARPAESVVDVVEMALDAGVPVAMVGQGLGPLTDRRLARRLHAVLPRLELVALREDVTAPPIVASLGVAAARVMVTGDDTVELAYERRPATLGDRLGLNIRVSGYAPLDAGDRRRIAGVVAAATERHSAPVVPLPVSFHPGERDLEQVLELARSVDVAIAPGGQDDPHSPVALIERAASCRVVVTGSYHAAVFALAQGVPAVGLVTSAYYEQKFAGLAGLFGAGCRRVDVAAADADAALAQAVDESWERADELRGDLLESARRQVEASRAAYRQLYDFVTGEQR
jgi:colanic acid/amylovoran biosynthesis protein